MSSPTRILWVAPADVPTDAAAGGELSGAHGFEVVRSPRTADPVRMIEDGHFEVVVADPSVPVEKGLALVDRIRQRGLDLPIILVSSRAEEPDSRLAVRAQRRGALVCETSALRQTVERTLDERGLRGPGVLPLRNRRGERVEVPSVTATDAKNEFGRVLETVKEKGAVAITRHDAAKAVLLSVEEYNALVAAQGKTDLDALSGEFDALLERMQTHGARRGMRAAFDASPGELGKTAVKAAAAATARKRG